MNILKLWDEATQQWVSVPAIQGPGVPTGGSTGQVLAKASGSDNDTEWKTLDASDVGALPSTTTAADLLSNLTYSTDGLTFSNGTILDGGYCKIGNLVIVNMRINVTTGISAGTVFMSGFPAALSTLGSTTGFVAVTASSPTASVSMRVNGSIINGSSSSTLSGAYMLSCVYLAET